MLSSVKRERCMKTTEKVFFASTELYKLLSQNMPIKSGGYWDSLIDVESHSAQNSFCLFDCFLIWGTLNVNLHSVIHSEMPKHTINKSLSDTQNNLSQKVESSLLINSPATSLGISAQLHTNWSDKKVTVTQMTFNSQAMQKSISGPEDHSCLLRKGNRGYNSHNFCLVSTTE